MIKIGIETSMGQIFAEIYDDKAPKTAAYFMRYVDDGFYNGAKIYRSLRRDNQDASSTKIDIVEMGHCNDYYDRILRFGMSEGEEYDETLGFQPPYPKISVETTEQTGITHENGTLSLGRDTVDQVDTNVFICIGSQSDLDFNGKRHPDGYGFSAFGRIVEGMDIVEEIHALPVIGQRIQEDIKIYKIYRL
jgi:peptidyl-prolyl cis-trans isomerase A (cyclophilin A)